MICPNCGSKNVRVQVINEVKEKRKKGVAYWLIIGWWLEPLLWLFLTLPKLLVALFSKKTKLKSKQKSIAVCQDCGNRWEIK